MSKQYEVGAYYFPNYHVDPLNEKQHGPGWTEWELLKVARPRFAGHQQPKVPLWGYEDESDPLVFAKKIDAAADHGITHFIFDWYYYREGKFLNGCLDRGYLKAPNNSRLKFALMWANHHWLDIHPAKYGTTPPAIYSASIDRPLFDRIMDHVIQDYFLNPNYLLVDGCPYFSIYEITTFMDGLGGLDAAREAILEFRRRVKAAGFPDLHLNSVLWGSVILPGESIVQNPNEVLQALGFDSFTSYVWIHHVWPNQSPLTSVKFMEDAYFEYAEKALKEITLPYYPNASMGWDPSPRCCQSDVYTADGYPWSPVISENAPKAFQDALVRLKDFMDRHGITQMNINAWNEWTEGSYLEPDMISGFGYLEAIRDVFGSHAG